MLYENISFQYLQTPACSGSFYSLPSQFKFILIRKVSFFFSSSSFCWIICSRTFSTLHLSCKGFKALAVLYVVLNFYQLYYLLY